MERKGEATKHQLAESFKELMLKGSFDKITIRMITEQAGSGLLFIIIFRTNMK